MKAARRDAIANLKCFGAPGHQRLNFGGSICIHYAAPPYSGRINPIYILLFGEVWLGPCATPGNGAECTIYGGFPKTPVLF